MNEVVADKLPYSIFIKAPLSNYRLIERGTLYPIEFVFEMCTIKDRQTQLELHLLKGEMDGKPTLQTFARYQIEGLPARPCGEVRAKVTLTIVGEQEFDLRVSVVDEINPKRLEVRAIADP